jgi:hypothetical protein
MKLNLPDPITLRSQLNQAGIPLVGEMAEAMARYELCLAKLVFKQLNALAMGLEVAHLDAPESPPQLQQMCLEDSALLQAAIKDRGQHGLD